MKYHLLAILPGLTLAGSFPDDDGIAEDTPGIWASSAAVDRGPVDATVPDGATTSHGSPADAIGASDASDDPTVGVVSLGDGGAATLRLSVPVADGSGADLAVFENGFSSAFLELAHVEVSSDGIHFVRFPSISQTQTDTQIGTFAFNGIDPTDLHNLAGKYEAGIGTPFDLAELRGVDPRLDVSHVTHVRVIDVVGSIDPNLGTTDSLGNPINDPFKTNFATGGFDLDAVGAMQAAPTNLPAWTTHHFPTGGATGDEEDPDGDRIPNLLEYATAGDPVHPSGPPLQFAYSGPSPQLTWRKANNRTGVTLILQGSSNLVDWTDLASSTDSAATSGLILGVAVSETAQDSLVTASVTANYTFFRLKAER
ncbi:hypothetical protein [Haloferula rosea]|uniref:Uncharacterized protein n=1 Tax=Haloferula rosea TaxID=490093 RepID=A0A934V9P3_9BACT|nr:hypothetical protein [Haloferula rosea]MBK1825453.1 hypothetical protein [Haloferula rosea]